MRSSSSNDASLVSVRSARTRGAMPALLTSASMRPNASSVCREQRVAVLAARDVALHRQEALRRRARGLLAQRDGLVGRRGVARVVDDDREAFGRRLDCDAATKPAARSGDQHDGDVRHAASIVLAKRRKLQNQRKDGGRRTRMERRTEAGGRRSRGGEGRRPKAQGQAEVQGRDGHAVAVDGVGGLAARAASERRPTVTNDRPATEAEEARHPERPRVLTRRRCGLNLRPARPATRPPGGSRRSSRT